MSAAPSPSKTTKKAYAPRKPGKKGDEKRREDERRQREEAQAAEARERERMTVADNDSRLIAMDLERRERNAARRKTESHDIDTLEKGREAKLEEFHSRLAKDVEWRSYLAGAEGSSLVTPRGSTIATPHQRVIPIDASQESEINTWISLWAEREQEDMRDTLQDAQSAELIMRDMDRVAANAERDGDSNTRVRIMRDIAALREIEMQQIDRATARIIQHADEHANAKNEVLLAYDTGDIKFCMWINLSKNPRVKTIEFADLSISVDIPKSLALASVAVRLIHYKYDNLSVGYNSEYASLGGVLHLDLLALPPPPKKVKGWTLRQVTPLATNIARLPYPGGPPSHANSLNTSASISVSSPSEHTPHPVQTPLAHSTSVSHNSSMSRSPSNPVRGPPVPSPTPATAAPTPITAITWAPIKVSWPVPRDVIVGAATPQAGWWDSEACTWRLDAVSTVEYHPDTRLVSLFTTCPAPLSLLYTVAHLYPFAGWELHPGQDNNHALLSVFTRTGVEVQIQIGEGICSLTKPDTKELQHLHAQKFEPRLLLKKMAVAGLALNSRASLPPGMTTPKDETLEKDTCRQVARMIRAFSFRQCHANATSGAQACLFQVGTPKDANSEYTEQLLQWRTCHVTPVGCHLLDREPTDGTNLFMDEEIAYLCVKFMGKT